MVGYYHPPYSFTAGRNGRQRRPRHVGQSSSYCLRDAERKSFLPLERDAPSTGPAPAPWSAKDRGGRG
jgi:hypothetical protein